MPETDDKLLLVLGVLLSQDSHGYGLIALLESPAAPIRIGRANAYKLLRKLEQRGWARAKQEKGERGGGRHTYRATAAGRKAFERMLRERLGTSRETEVADAVSLDFSSMLTEAAVTAQLEARLASLKERCNSMDRFTKDERRAHLGLDLRIHLLNQERSWLEQTIKRRKGRK
ncbi:MAG: helix-turn-helix transcriptional regulator [Polyangiaceae bacterium]